MIEFIYIIWYKIVIYRSSKENMNFLTGIGYDVHELKKGAPLIVGGIRIESDHGCISHSDGDALIHAIIDSLLGASGKNDIGYYFPASEVKYGTSSLILLEKTIDIIKDYKIVNIDSIVVLQNPPLYPYREEIRKNLARVCRIEDDQINIKFKTEENLGFTGKNEGIKAFASCLLSY